MFLLGAIAFIIWLLALWVTRERVLEGGCDVEKNFFVRLLCDSYGIFGIVVITPILRLVIISFALVVAAFLQGDYIQGLFKHKSLRNWDSPLILIVIGVALINSIHDILVSTDIIILITLGLIIFYSGIPLLIFITGLIYLKYIREANKDVLG